MFAAVLGVFLAYRLVAHYVRLESDARKYRTASPPAATPAARPEFW